MVFKGLELLIRRVKTTHLHERDQTACSKKRVNQLIRQTLPTASPKEFLAIPSFTNGKRI